MIKFPFNVTELINSLASLIRGDRKPEDLISPIPNTPAPPQEPNYADVIKEGLTEWGHGKPPPMATMSAQLADLGAKLPNRYLPAALTLKESGGLSNPKAEEMRRKNNPFGIKPPGGLAQYPDLPTAIMGGGTGGVNGGPQQGLRGVLLGKDGKSAYSKYLESGNLADFFSTYTPEGDNNPSYEKQISDMQALLDIFDKVEQRHKQGKAVAKK